MQNQEGLNPTKKTPCPKCEKGKMTEYTINFGVANLVFWKAEIGYEGKICGKCGYNKPEKKSFLKYRILAKLLDF